MSVLIAIDEKHLEAGGVFRLPRMTDDEYWEFCQRNRDLRWERNHEGEILLMPPTGGETGIANSALTRYLDEWAERDGTGVVFDSSTQFRLPGGGERSPDASWVARARWDALTEAERSKFPPLAPDFAVEIRSPSDTLKSLQEKMDEYLASGTRLGWLIDRKNRRVYVYRPGTAVTVLEDPPEVSGDPELPGFVLRMARIF
jgi:Uma2 family endonuclease